MKLEEQYREPYKAWMDRPTKESTQELLKTIQPILQQAVRVYTDDPNSLSLRAIAKKIAVDALRKYNPDQSALRTHLMNHLQGLRRYSRKQLSVIPVPERASFELQRLNQATQELEDQYGAPPTDAQLSDYTHLSLPRIKKLRGYRLPVNTGSFVFNQTEGEEDSGVGPAVTDSIPDDIRMEYLRGNLSPIDQNIMEMSWGYNGKKPMANKEIADKLKLSPGRIVQRKQKIQELLDAPDLDTLIR